ncbi:OLC1v1023729C2 [Oldenlandia corymbosa var. corymbosa]|nr:OLC1v1023729C2 [Oldenlandia corymbosa var. corymbosa]
MRSDCLTLSLEGNFSSGFPNEVKKFRREVESVELKIDKCYFTLSESVRSQSHPMMMITSQVNAIFDSILESIEYFFTLPRLYIEFFDLPVETVEENIKFLRNFVRFATLLGAAADDESGLLLDFVTYIEELAIHAAHLTLSLFPITKSETEFMVFALLLVTKPVGPRAYETYTRALVSLKDSGALNVPTVNMTDDSLIIVEDFLVSLLSNLWDMLLMDAVLVVSKVELQAMYEGLRSLRTILKQKPDKFMFDTNVKDLVRFVLCDAGVVIFSLYQSEIVVDLGVPDLLRNIRLIRTEVEDQVSETSICRFPNTNVLGFLDFLLENLLEVGGSYEVDSVTQSYIKTFEEHLHFLKSLLRKLQNQQEELQALYNLVVEVAYKIESPIEQLMLGDIQGSFSTSFGYIKEDIEMIKTVSIKILHCRGQPIQRQKVDFTSSSQVTSQRSTATADEVVGFETEMTTVIDRLTRGSSKLQVVAIVGMPGSGKTTLAKKVYNDPSVMYHFHACAWCSISQVFNTKEVALTLLKQTLEKLPNGILERSEAELVQELWRSLKRRRYLIFVDDVWDIQSFDRLKGLFPDDSYGSRILLTSRQSDVAPENMLDEKPHTLRSLTTNESLELLKMKLFPMKHWPASSYEIGMQIAECCKGLPLTIVLVAGLLSTTKQEAWNEVLQSLRSGTLSSMEPCYNAIELSYRHLPDHLKPCLLSFGAFLEDQEVSVKRLVWYWTAEGFVQKTKLKSLKEVAANYLKNLIDRSLVIGVKKSSTGGVKTCCTHDLLHEFCLRKAKEENFLQLLRGREELACFNEPGNLRRLCVHSEPKHLRSSKLFCPRIRSLHLFGDPTAHWGDVLLDASFIFHTFKLLRVLDMDRVILRYGCPSEIGVLVQLRYLAIHGRRIGPSIGNLCNLETLILCLVGGETVTLPETLWNLQKLKQIFLTFRGGNVYGIDFPVHNLDNCPDLHELETLSSITSDSWDIMEKQLRKFPNIHRLRCRLQGYRDHPNNGSRLMIFSFLNKLESLHLSFQRRHDWFSFVFPENLKKLTLYGCELPWEKITMVAELRHLEVLKLLNQSFTGKTWNMEEGQFTKLRFLKLKSLDIIKWAAASDEQFPNLEKLVLESCSGLEEIPIDSLQYVSTLEMIEISYCPHCVATAVDKIRETQVEMGNSAFKVHVRSSGY